MNFATIFAGNANNENNYAIGFAVRVKKIGEKVGRLIPKGVLIDAVHNRDNGYMYYVGFYLFSFISYPEAKEVHVKSEPEIEF